MQTVQHVWLGAWLAQWSGVIQSRVSTCTLTPSTSRLSMTGAMLKCTGPSLPWICLRQSQNVSKLLIGLRVAAAYASSAWYRQFTCVASYP